MITQEQIEAIKAAIIRMIATLGDELVEFITDNLDTLIALQCQKCSDLQLLYLFVQLDALTLAQDFVRERVDESRSQQWSKAERKFDASNERHGESNAASESEACSWSTMTGQRQWFRDGESHQTMGMSEGASSNGHSDAVSDRVEDRSASGWEYGFNMYQGTVTGYVFVKGEAHDDAFSDGETFSNDVTGGESVRVEISLPTIDTVSGTLGYFQRKSHAENNGSAHSTTDRFTDTRRFSLTASEFENKDASADQSSFTRTATRFTESSREGSAHMNMGMSGNSRQHADAQQGRDSAAHSDSKAHSRMASESQSHAQSEGTENRDKQGQSMSRKWGQIGASLAAFLDNVQGQIDALLHRKSINQSSAWRKMPTGTIQPHPCNPQWGHGLYILPACGPVGVPMQGQPVPATAPTGLPRRLNGL